MEEAVRVNDNSNHWEIMRRMGGTKRGPKKRKRDVPLSEYPDTGEWLKHLQQEGKEGGCTAGSALQALFQELNEITAISIFSEWNVRCGYGFLAADFFRFCKLTLDDRINILLNSWKSLKKGSDSPGKATNTRKDENQKVLSGGHVCMRRGA
jgi:hypothetical protein